MKQKRWMVQRRSVGHVAAQQRWDRAYQLLLQATAAPAGEPTLSAAPWDATKESHHASSRLRSGLDPAPNPGADH